MLTKIRVIEIVTQLLNPLKSLGFVTGVCWLQQQATLPENSVAWTIPLLAVLIIYSANYSAPLARLINALLIFVFSCFRFSLGSV